MKRNLVFSSMLGVLCFSMLSFSLIKKDHILTKHTVSKNKTTKKSNCTASITGVTLVSVSGSSATITITYSGSPDHFQYGGYYNRVAYPAGSPPITTTNLYTTTLVLPLGANCGARVWFQCVCSDGTAVGATHGVLFGCGDPTIYF
ncbi:MAG: hypothetical protein JWP78_2689 [Mucilaginibacter sp.]|nr:hypothetical protein [Mucilaginibacter sp.]